MAQLSKSMLEEIYERHNETVAQKKVHRRKSGEISPVRLRYSINSSIDTPQEALEKIRGKNNLTSISTLLRGYEVGQAVGLIFDPKKEVDNSAIGSAFLIAPQMLITNNHVIDSVETAKTYRLRMNYQRDLDGQIDPVFDFELIPEKFFVTDTYLDFSIIAVKPFDVQGKTPLSDFGYLKMYEESGKITSGEFAAVIQHPDGKPKQTAYFENKVDFTENPNFITYTTDTLGGSSGSPVFNYEWLVFALHHAGIPSSLEEIKNASDDNSIEELSFSREANEGIRVSAIMKKLKELNDECYRIIKMAAEAPMIDSVPRNPFKYSRDFRENQTKTPDLESVTNTQPTISVTSDNEKNKPQTPIAAMNQDQNVLRFNIPIEIRIGNISTAVMVSDSNSATETIVELEGNKKKKPANSQISSPENRTGYEPKFLGNALEINLADIYKPFLDKNLVAPTLDNGNELHYTHFSLAMHKTRRTCIITAVNIDGNQEKKITREDDKWFLDGRMNTKYQLDNSMYSNNDLDRGHMVRREDPNWGDDAEIANEDTFFYTNACPQHKNLNQREWLALETYVLKNTQTNDLKVSVFTGPVIDENFVPYREGVVPAQFFKIVAMIKKDGKPSVTGYVLSQKEMISGLEKVQTDFEFSKFKTYQVSLSKIEEMTSLDLSKIKTYDPLKTEQEGILKEISSANDLVL